MNTREDNLKIVREACIAANPEIMELKFGCEFQRSIYDEFGPYTIISEAGICNRHKRTHEGCYDPSGDCSVDDGVWARGGYESDGYYDLHVKETDIGEIIGRPIRLADVLLAIKTSPKCDTYWEYEVVADIIWDNAQIPRCWNLHKDDLTEQSDETVAFLADLLSNSKN